MTSKALTSCNVLNLFKLDGQTALVTDAARGIGFEVARALTEAGASVIIADLDPAVGEAATSSIGTPSMSGMISNRPQPQSGYNASRAAVIHLTCSLAGEWASRGVRVNSVAPGYGHADGPAGPENARVARDLAQGDPAEPPGRAA